MKLENGGPWLGAVRNWIQWNCINGSSVTWGSSEILRCTRNFTPHLLEELAFDIVRAQFPEWEKLENKIEELRKKNLELQAQLAVYKTEYNQY